MALATLRFTKNNKSLHRGDFCFRFVRPEVIETSTYPWQGHVIPLNHGRGGNDYSILRPFVQTYERLLVTVGGLMSVHTAQYSNYEKSHVLLRGF